MAKQTKYEKDVIKTVHAFVKKWRRGYFDEREAEKYKAELVDLIEECVKKVEEWISQRKE